MNAEHTRHSVLVALDLFHASGKAPEYQRLRNEVHRIVEQLEACEADRSSLSQSADYFQEQLEAALMALSFIRQWTEHPDRTEAIYQIRERLESHPAKNPGDREEEE